MPGGADPAGENVSMAGRADSLHRASFGLWWGGKYVEKGEEPMTLPTPRRRRLSVSAAALGTMALIAPMSAAIADTTPEAEDINAVRLAGDNRYGTAQAVANYDFDDGADEVFLALGTDFADALAGAPAAEEMDAPILLTRSDRLPKETKSALATLNPEKVHLLGGRTAITTKVRAEVREAVTGDVSVTRYAAGDDRYETAVQVSTKTHPEGADTVYVANGRDYPDALAAGPLAVEEDAPILLIRSDRIPEVVAAELERLSPDRIVILGGTSAVSDSVETELQELAAMGVDRIGGDNRYETAVEISKALVEDDDVDGIDTVYLATGEDFADALAGGASAADADAPILLVRSDRVADVVLDEIKRLTPENLVVLGGQTAIADAVVESVKAALAEEPEEEDDE